MRVHISTHAPAGGATSGAGANGIARSHFYSRPCGRGDAHGRTYGSFRQISTHAPAGGATPPLPGGPTTYSFLLTPLREGRRSFLREYNILVISFLLTPLREGRLAAPERNHAGGAISTHAPAGGATQHVFLKVRNGIISTHAPAGGATASTSCISLSSNLFLLTPLREGRREYRAKWYGEDEAFLLTPLREGRLVSSCRATAEKENFYSRPCGRGDGTQSKCCRSLNRFLLTPLREGRLRSCR